MTKFLKALRKKLLDQERSGNYFKYAIGEIVLVVIGILIALQINNLNENRKSNITARDIYRNLLTSLAQDSLEVDQIIKLQSRSIDAILKEILKGGNHGPDKFVDSNIDVLAGDISLAGMSFFPKTGIYNLIVSNNGMDLLKSNRIKALLINLYDYQYKKYENVDIVIDHKYQYQIGPILRKKIGFIITYNPDLQVVHSADPALFREHYAELMAECMDIYGTLSTGRNYLVQIRESIHELLQSIRNELEK